MRLRTVRPEAEVIDLDNGMAMMHGRGNTLRPVCFGPGTGRVVDRYIRVGGGHRWHTWTPSCPQRGHPPLTASGGR
jgi:hypothetical protein